MGQKRGNGMTGLNTIRRAFIKSALVLAAGAATLGLPSVSAEEYAEKEELKFGFIKLTDMAPLAVAYEKGFLKTKVCTSPWKHRRTGKFCSTASSTVSWMVLTCWQASLWVQPLVSVPRRTSSPRSAWT